LDLGKLKIAVDWRK